MYIATSATTCIYVYVCNSLICHSFDFKRIKNKYMYTLVLLGDNLVNRKFENLIYVVIFMLLGNKMQILFSIQF